jgi:hypothetical protein
MTIVQQFEEWYAQRKEHLSKVFLRTQMGLTEPTGPDGEVGFGMETASVIANIMLYNSGLIDIPAVHKASKKDFTLDQRHLAPDEDLAVLLDRYVEELISME